MFFLVNLNHVLLTNMIFLKKPFTPTVNIGEIKTFNVYGKSFTRLQAVYLSGSPYENQTFYNPFSSVPRLSALYPGFSGVKLLSSQYTTNFQNTITFTVPRPTLSGYIDVIAQNPAGYGTVTQYVVKDLYSGTLPLTAARPWALGIQVLSAGGAVLPTGQIYTIAGDIIITISTQDNIVIIE